MKDDIKILWGRRFLTAAVIHRRSGDPLLVLAEEVEFADSEDTVTLGTDPRDTRNSLASPPGCCGGIANRTNNLLAVRARRHLNHRPRTSSHRLFVWHIFERVLRPI